MKKNISTILLILVTLTCFAQYPPLAWAKKIQAVDYTNSQCSFGVSHVDEQGYIYGCGYFRDSVRPEQNQPNLYLTGNNNWDSGMFAKYAADGALVWADKIVARQGYFTVTSMAVDKFHSVYVLCNAIYTDTIDFDPGNGVTNTPSDGNDYFFAKYDANGNFLWVKLLNVANSTNANSNKPNVIAVDSNLNIYVGGQFQSQMDIDPGAATVNIVNPNGVSCNCTVGFYAKYDSNGSLVWYQIDGNNAAVSSIDVHNPSGNILIGGRPSAFSGNQLRLVNSAGNSLYVLSGGSNLYVNSVKFNPAGDIYFSGTYASGGNDFDWGAGSFIMSTAHSYEPLGFVGKYNSSGVFQWAVSCSTGNVSYFARYYNISVDPTDDNPILSYGESNGSGYLKGFYKIDAGTGASLWGNSKFSSLVGLGGTYAIASPSDGTIVLSMDAGFSSNANLTIDAAPDPAVISNIIGIGYWGMIAKYGACISAPVMPGSIIGSASLCSTQVQTYSVPAVSEVNSYTWSLPSGWSGNSATNFISVIPSSNGGTISVTANNLCGASTARTLLVSYTNPPTVTATSSALTVCAGTTVTLNGSGATQYVWSNGITDNVPFVPSSTVTYTVTGTTNGCSDTGAITVTVNPIPLVGASATATTLCAGEQTTLTGTGAATYQWSNGVTNGVAFTPASTTTYTVTGISLGCSDTSSVIVMVTPLPTVTTLASDTFVCSGNQTVLSASGATTYNWSSGIVNAQSFTPTFTQTYSVTGTINGCSDTDSILITVGTIPTILIEVSQDTVCLGEMVTLEASGALNYQWSTSDFGGTLYVSPPATSTYSVTASDINSCSATASQEVVARDPIDVSTVVNGVVITANELNAVYQWRSCNSNTDIMGANSQSYTATVNGDYAVIVTSSAGCSDTSSCVSITEVGVEEPDESVIVVLPNPFIEHITILIRDDKKQYVVEIFSTTGQMIKRAILSTEKVQISMNEVSSGVYFVRVFNGQCVYQKRVVKE